MSNFRRNKYGNNTDGNKYWIAENENGKIVGGVGIGKLEGIDIVK